jgi:hypothetical protein
LSSCGVYVLRCPKQRYLPNTIDTNFVQYDSMVWRCIENGLELLKRGWHLLHGRCIDIHVLHGRCIDILVWMQFLMSYEQYLESRGWLGTQGERQRPSLPRSGSLGKTEQLHTPTLELARGRLDEAEYFCELHRSRILGCNLK